MSTFRENVLKKLEELVLRLEVEPDKEILSDILELLKDMPYSSMPLHYKILFQQFEIFTQEIKNEEIPLDKDSIFVLELLIKKIETKRTKEEIENEDLSLISEFLEESENILKELQGENPNYSSLLHRLKGIIGIYVNICEEEMKAKGEDLLKMVKAIEQEARAKRVKKEDIQKLTTIFEEIKKHYGRI